MIICVAGCLHGELQKTYDIIQEREKKENYKVDLLLICGDLEFSRNIADLRCVAKPEHWDIEMRMMGMGTFYKYYSGELKAPVLTIVVSGNHEASNYLQEMPFGGWLCPNIYYLGRTGVVDLVNEVGHVALTIGGISGIYKGDGYNKEKLECPPYSYSTKRTVYHIRKTDIDR